MKKSILVMKSLVLAGALFFVSCNDDDGITCPEALTGELTAAETEFSGKWAFSAMVAEDAIDITKDDTDNPNKDIFAQYTDCERDLVYDFMNNRNYSLKQGSLALDCNNKDSFTGTWSLTADNTLRFVANCASQNTQITLNEAGDSFSYSSSLSFRDVSNDVKTTKVTFTYTKAGEVVTPE